ncbi:MULTISPECIES: hypothetical protein [unclassified Coleofasciculus]|uniref:hypothetical protein n=1 Tax=unclassified Coleofasciculus TaxID=2692782 RepID=UPI00187E750A|nr:MULTISPECIES: hypothetical protein [unclassified Coleofasciculus]MBE9127813.1 hypothetical protein [Coleofasciculus sp. LEGE 07081]MBE9149434.1 hypothetical protein [Coleofasciculus sp. LEGE 07092]
MFNLTFTRNLAATTVILTLVSLGLAEVHNHPETTPKQQRFQQIESGMKMVVVVKTQQLPHR